MGRIYVYAAAYLTTLVVARLGRVYSTSWLNTGVTGSWTSSASDASGSLLLATSSLGGNVYQSVDYGFTWTIISSIPTQNENWFGIATNQNGSISACVSNAGDGGPGNMYISIDSSEHWTENTGASTTAFWANIDMSLTGQYIIGPANINGVVYLSTDYGGSWSEISSLPDAYYNWAIVSGSGQFMYAVVGGVNGGVGLIYYSQDYGAAWQETTAPTKAWYGITCDDGGQYLVAVTANEYIYVSTNRGSTWSIAAGAPSTSWHGVASSSDGANVAAVVYGNDCSQTIFISVDYGLTFNEAVSPGTGSCWWTVSMNADASIVLIGDPGGDLYVGNGLFLPPEPTVHPTNVPTIRPTARPTFFPTYSTDANAIVWTPAMLPAYTWAGVAMDSSATYMAVTATGQSSTCLWLTSDSGNTWFPSTVPVTSSSGVYYLAEISSSGQQMVIVSTGGNGYYSSDYGNRWDAIVAPSLSWSDVAMTSSGEYVYLITDSNADYIYMSTDYGAVFNQLTTSPHLQWTTVTVCGTVVFAASYQNSVIYKSTDYGSTWSIFSSAPNGWIAVVCDTSNNGETLIAIGADAVDDDVTKYFLTTNGGMTWSSISTPPSVVMEIIVGNSDLSVIAGVGINKDNDDLNQDGVYLSEDLGKTWVLTSAPSYAQLGGLALSSDGTVALLAANANGVLVGSVSNLPGSDGSSKNLSAGGIAGIVISAIFVVTAVAAALYFRKSISKYVFGESGSNSTTQSLFGSPSRPGTTISINAVDNSVQNPIDNQRTMSGEQFAANFNSQM